VETDRLYLTVSGYLLVGLLLALGQGSSPKKAGIEVSEFLGYMKELISICLSLFNESSTLFSRREMTVHRAVLIFISI